MIFLGRLINEIISTVDTRLQPRHGWTRRFGVNSSVQGLSRTPCFIYAESSSRARSDIYTAARLVSTLTKLKAWNYHLVCLGFSECTKKPKQRMSSVFFLRFFVDSSFWGLLFFASLFLDFFLKAHMRIVILARWTGWKTTKALRRDWETSAKERSLSLDTNRQ